MRYPGMQCCTFSGIDLVLVVLYFHLRVLSHVIQNRALSIVRGAIVHNDDFFFNALRQLHLGNFLQNQLNGISFIVSWNQNG